MSACCWKMRLWDAYQRNWKIGTKTVMTSGFKRIACWFFNFSTRNALITDWRPILSESRADVKEDKSFRLRELIKKDFGCWLPPFRKINWWRRAQSGERRAWMRESTTRSSKSNWSEYSPAMNGVNGNTRKARITPKGIWWSWACCSQVATALNNIRLGKFRLEHWWKH